MQLDPRALRRTDIDGLVRAAVGPQLDERGSVADPLLVVDLDVVVLDEAVDADAEVVRGLGRIMVLDELGAAVTANPPIAGGAGRGAARVHGPPRTAVDRDS